MKWWRAQTSKAAMKMSDERLAIEGGAPVFPEGPPRWPRADERIREVLLHAFADGSWGKYHAGYVEALEARLAAYHGVSHALTCASGTFAVELALRALKIGEGDEVALAGYDFGGNFRAIEAVGARPVLVDIEPGTWCIDVAALAEILTPQIKAVIVSHLHGGIADMQAIFELCRERGIRIVDDACQIPGGEVQGRVAGTWGDVGVLSFGGSKLLTAGRGGAIVTNDPHAAQRAKVYCERGNHAFPLSELQAALLLPQLETLDQDNAVRRARVGQLLREVSGLAGLQPLADTTARGQASFYKVAWLYQGDGQRSREQFIAAIQREGVAMDAGFRGFAGRSAARCRRSSSLAQSIAAAAQTVVLHHPVLLESPATIERLVGALRKVLERA